MIFDNIIIFPVESAAYYFIFTSTLIWCANLNLSLCNIICMRLLLLGYLVQALFHLERIQYLHWNNNDILMSYWVIHLSWFSTICLKCFVVLDELVDIKCDNPPGKFKDLFWPGTEIPTSRNWSWQRLF